MQKQKKPSKSEPELDICGSDANSIYYLYSDVAEEVTNILIRFTSGEVKDAVIRVEDIILRPSDNGEVQVDFTYYPVYHHKGVSNKLIDGIVTSQLTSIMKYILETYDCGVTT